MREILQVDEWSGNITVAGVIDYETQKRKMLLPVEVSDGIGMRVSADEGWSRTGEAGSDNEGNNGRQHRGSRNARQTPSVDSGCGGSHTATATIEVEILPENDNAPVITLSNTEQDGNTPISKKQQRLDELIYTVPNNGANMEMPVYLQVR